METIERPFAGEQVTYAFTQTVLGLAVEEAADLIWATADDTHVSIRLDYVTRPPRRSMEVTSAHGEIVWDALDSRVQITTPEGERLSTRYGGDLDRDAVLLRQVRALDSVLQGGEENGLLDLKTARLAVEITERARSHDANSTTTIPKG